MLHSPSLYNMLCPWHNTNDLLQYFRNNLTRIALEEPITFL